MSHAQQAGLALKGIGVVQQPDSMQPDKKHDRELLLAAQKMLGGKLPKGSDGMPSMFWGSGAISFSAIMAMLKAALEAMNDYAKTQQKTAVFLKLYFTLDQPKQLSCATAKQKRTL